MKKLILIVGVLTLVGCGSSGKLVTTHYRDCLTEVASIDTIIDFNNVVSCGKDKRSTECRINNNCSLNGDQFVLKNDQLVYLLNTKQIDLSNAVLSLQNNIYTLEAEVAAERARQQRVMGMALMNASNQMAGKAPVYSPQQIAAQNPIYQNRQQSQTIVIDYDWDWDGFYNANEDWVWMCRGIQTGQFATPDNCRNDFKTDSRWYTPRKTGDY